MDDIHRRYAVSVLFLSAVVFFSLLVSLNPDTANSLGGDLVAGSFVLKDDYNTYQMEGTVAPGASTGGSSAVSLFACNFSPGEGLCLKNSPN